MKIYTKRGDNGQTDLYKGGRVTKDDPGIDACGWLDSLSAELGLTKVLFRNDEAMKHLLTDLQKDMIEIGAFVSSMGKTPFPAQRVEEMEVLIDKIDAKLPHLKDFVIPGANLLEAQLHRTRTVCRTAERRLVQANRGPDNALNQAIIYLNRLSDLLFVLARKESL